MLSICIAANETPSLCCFACSLQGCSVPFADGTGAAACPSPGQSFSPKPVPIAAPALDPPPAPAPAPVVTKSMGPAAPPTMLPAAIPVVRSVFSPSNSLPWKQRTNEAGLSRPYASCHPLSLLHMLAWHGASCCIPFHSLILKLSVLALYRLHELPTFVLSGIVVSVQPSVVSVGSVGPMGTSSSAPSQIRSQGCMRGLQASAATG